MADMDLDELMDGPAKGPARPARFAPKGAKFKPRPKTEASESQSLKPTVTDSVEQLTNEIDSIPMLKKEKIDTELEYTNGTVEMDVDVKTGEKDENAVKKEDGDDFMEIETNGEAEVEAEDEVVREIDVYFTPSVDPGTRLYVLQYPLRPLWRPYELDERCELVRVNTATAGLEVDLAVDVDSKNYDLDADPRLQTKKQTLTSVWKPPNKSGYVVGVLTGNKLHLNPIHAVVQLRPSMLHIDSRESKRKTGVSSNVEDKVKVEESSQGKAPGASKKLGKPSVQNKDIGEGWVALKYHGARSDLAARYLQKMMAEEGSPISFSMNSCEYLNSLCPSTTNDQSRSKVPLWRSLMALSLKERFRTWLVEGAPVHRFDALKHLAPEASVEDILGVLQEYAHLVQGLWVPKSPLVYGSDQGIEVLARNRVLVLFSKNAFIKNSDLTSHSQLAKAMKDVLNVLAVERPAFSDWKLVEVPDISFIKSNSSVVKKQEEELECLEKKINDFLSRGRNGPGVKASSKSNTTNHLTTSKTSNKVATRVPNGATSRSSLSEEAREVIKKALQKLFKTVKVCSYQQISQRLRDMAVSESARATGFAREAVAAANNIDAFPDELQAILSHVAVNIHGVCVPKSSPDHPQYDPFRKVVIDLLVAEGPNAKLKKAPIIEAAKLELKRDIPPMEYQKVLQELCLSQGSAWILKSGDGNQKH